MGQETYQERVNDVTSSCIQANKHVRAGKRFGLLCVCSVLHCNAAGVVRETCVLAAGEISVHRCRHSTALFVDTSLRRTQVFGIPQDNVLLLNLI